MMLLANTLFFLSLSLFSHSVKSTLCTSMDSGSPWTMGHQDPLSMGFSGQEYLSGFPFPPLEDLPNLGIETMSPALEGGFFTTEPVWKHLSYLMPNCPH